VLDLNTILLCGSDKKEFGRSSSSINHSEKKGCPIPWSHVIPHARRKSPANPDSIKIRLFSERASKYQAFSKYFIHIDDSWRSSFSCQSTRCLVPTHPCLNFFSRVSLVLFDPQSRMSDLVWKCCSNNIK
jgi:hypothetical protein